MDRVITTRRLQLRPLRATDAAVIASTINDYAIAKNMTRVPHPYALTDAEAFLGWALPPQAHTRFSAITLTAAGDALAGIISYEWNKETQAAEFGYWLSRPHWGRGLMSEAAQAMVEHAFVAAGVPLLTTCYFNDNPASGQVLRKAGFQEVGPCTAFSVSQNRHVPVTTMRLPKSAWRPAG